MSTVTVIPLDVYTLIYQHSKTTTPSVFNDVIDISIERDCIKFQPLKRDRTESDSRFVPDGLSIILKRGRVVAVYQSDTLMVITKRT